ncbi:NAD(P)-binding protein [Allokutzneria oryzae]|uniref:NAD(P)-binding protein n=1 Tax=Allokutzneria oryzae TaxID=1378989 RepID=A0ABV6A7H7_9PSEU
MPERHLIIGAGFSGLPVAKRLAGLGRPLDVVDRNSGIGTPASTARRI